MNSLPTVDEREYTVVFKSINGLNIPYKAMSALPGWKPLIIQLTPATTDRPGQTLSNGRGLPLGEGLAARAA